MRSNLVSHYGATMARYPEWCAQYGALKNVPNSVLEGKLTIHGTTAPELHDLHEYTQLLRYCLKWNAELIRMYETDGERSTDRFRQPHYHALIIKDNSRIRLFYEYKLQRGHVRGWREHYIYMNVADLYSEIP